MKHILSALIACLGIVTNSAAQSRTLDSAELKYIAVQLKEGATSIGVFEVPDIESQLKAMKSGYIPEMDDDYLTAAIEYNVLKIYTLRTIKGSFDSLVFIKLPVPDLEGMDNFSFFSYPGSSWILFLKPCLTTSSDGTKVFGWLKQLPKTYADYKFVSENSAFQLESASHGSYNLTWPEKTDRRPPQVMITNQLFVNDLLQLAAWVGQPDSNEKTAALQLLLTNLATKEGKTVAAFLAR